MSVLASFRESQVRASLAVLDGAASWSRRPEARRSIAYGFPQDDDACECSDHNSEGNEGIGQGYGHFGQDEKPKDCSEAIAGQSADDIGRLGDRQENGR